MNSFIVVFNLSKNTIVDHYFETDGIFSMYNFCKITYQLWVLKEIYTYIESSLQIKKKKKKTELTLRKSFKKKWGVLNTSRVINFLHVVTLPHVNTRITTLCPIFPQRVGQMVGHEATVAGPATWNLFTPNLYRGREREMGREREEKGRGGGGGVWEGVREKGREGVEREH